MSRRSFGNEGIHGIANRELTPELALAVGRATAAELGCGERPPRLLVGRDTRLSGPMLEAALAAGVAAAGGDVDLAGVVPTPGVARLVGRDGYDGGVALSASDRPFDENGIVLLGADGHRLADEVGFRVEGRLATLLSPADAGADADVVRDGELLDVGEIRQTPAAGPRYVEDLLAALGVDLSGVRVLLDCAHGATYRLAPLAFRAAGAVVETVGGDPDGRNINFECGAAHPRFVAAHVPQGDFDLGLAFDGDGGRVVAVDAAGRPMESQRLDALVADMQPKRTEPLPFGSAVMAEDGIMIGLLLANALRLSGRPPAGLVARGGARPTMRAMPGSGQERE